MRRAGIVASSMFALMIVSASNANAEALSVEDRPSLQNLPIIQGAEECRWDGPGENSVCRGVRPTRLTAALEYPLLMRSQGWREVHPGHGAPRGEEGGVVSHGDVLWFERPIDATCSECATAQLLPPPPSAGRRSTTQDYVVLIQSDYTPVCGAERQAQ